MPLVSVAMPSYNHAKFLREAIETVLGQTFEDFELVIIDDASTDESQQIINEFLEKDSRIKAIFHKQNKGICKTVNDCIENSRGEYIAFTASDDMWHKDLLKKQIEILENDEDLVVWCDGRIIDADSRPTGELCSKVYSTPKSGYIFEDLLRTSIFGSGIIIKRDNLIKMNEKLKFICDRQFYIDMGYLYKFYFIEEPLAMYRVHGKNTKFRDIDSWYKDSLLICIHVLQEYGDKISNKGLKNLFNATCVDPTYFGIHQDRWNKSNFIYPIILPLVFATLTLKSFLTGKIRN
jgi:glycosyltransferase involved in cell wall biosynthesis